VDKHKILEFVAFELAGYGISHQRQKFSGLGAEDTGIGNGCRSMNEDLSVDVSFLIFIVFSQSGSFLYQV
jgi:hypothetical protein